MTKFNENSYLFITITEIGHAQIDVIFKNTKNKPFMHFTKRW